MKKETLKHFIFKKMAKDGWVLDSELAKFIKETKGEEYHKEHDLPFCQAPENQFYKIPKIYFDYLKEKGIEMI